MFLIDEASVEAANDQFVRESTRLIQHVNVINSCLLIISEIAQRHGHKNTDELVVLRLGIRMFNSAGAGIKCARSGYYQPAFSMIRDILETGFLLDLFFRDRGHIGIWVTASAEERRKLYSPVKVREALDEIDGYKAKNRYHAYASFSTYAAHPDPNGFAVVSPGGDTQIGPFPDRDRIRAFIEELAARLTHKTVIFNTFFEDYEALDDIHIRFTHAFEPWAKVHMPELRMIYRDRAG